MPSFQPPPPSPAPQRKQGVDVRTLSLAQLHHFAQRGSRSAKAELERRMQAAGSAPARTPAAPAPRAAPTPRRAPPTVPAELAATRIPRRPLPTVPSELTPIPAPRRAPPTVPGELGAMRPPRRTPPTVPGALAPASAPRPAPADGAFPSLPEPDTQPQSLPPRVDMDIGSDKTPARHLSSAPFPTTEMLGELLPMADTSDKPFTPSYTIDVHPEDMLPTGDSDDDGASPQFMAVSKTEYLPFPTTEVIDKDHPAPPEPPPAPSAPAHRGREEHGQRPLPPHLREPREARTPATRQPPHLREPREAHAPQTRQPPHLRKPRAPDSLSPQFRESHAPDSLQPFDESHAPDSRQPFDESHAPEEHRHHHRRRKARRPDGVPSRPTPLLVRGDAAGLDSQQERMAEQLTALTRQESAQTRADDVPRFIGLVTMMWGVLVAFGGMLTKGHGLYFLASGVVIIGVGWLLFKRKRLALPVHLVALPLFLAWAWLGGKSVSAFEAVFQAAPLLVPAIWTLFPSVREPLE